MRKTKKIQPELTHTALLAKVNYDPGAGVFTWRESSYRRPIIGKPAGWTDNTGHINIEIFGKRYKAGRLAWFYMKGEWPAHEVDHRDRDPSNNRWENLREATRSLNNVNRVRARKEPLPRGVNRNKKGFGARLGVDGKVRWLGTYATAEEAGEVYRKAALKTYGEFLPQ